MKTAVQISDNASRLGGGMFESVRGMSAGLAMTNRWTTRMVAGRDRYIDQDAHLWQDRLRLPGTGVGDRYLPPVAMARLIGAEQPDILHLHGIWGPASMAAALFCRRAPQVPVLISPRGMLEPWAMEQHRARKRVAWQLWMGGLIRRSVCLHALCQEEADALRALVPAATICTVPNGVTLPDAPGAEDLAARRDGRRLLFIGRIHPKKGLKELIQAWCRMPQLAADGWTLSIAGWDAGSGHEQELRDLAAELGAGPAIRFLGPVYGDDKLQHLRAASGFVLTSFSEGLPMAVLEAWSHALPVLMTDGCHLSEGFAAGAALRTEPDPAAIAAALQDFCLDRDAAARAAMGARGRDLVEQRFTWARVGAQMAEIYDWAADGADWQAAPDTVALPGAGIS